LTDQISVLGQLTFKLGYRCIYVLVDKLDENTLTGGASSSYQFVAPLVSDLQLLELSGFGFKFFLWDMLMDEYRAVARPDRVKYYSLRWEATQLAEMLSRRLKAHSGEKISSLGQISSLDARAKIDGAVALFSQGSPRNTIRICKGIWDQQSEINSSSSELSTEALGRCLAPKDR